MATAYELRTNTKRYEEKRKKKGEVKVAIWVPEEKKEELKSYAEKLRNGEVYKHEKLNEVEEQSFKEFLKTLVRKKLKFTQRELKRINKYQLKLANRTREIELRLRTLTQRQPPPAPAPAPEPEYVEEESEIIDPEVRGHSPEGEAILREMAAEMFKDDE